VGRRPRGVNLHLLHLGDDIADYGLSRLFMTIAGAFAELERDRIRERITQVKRDQKARHRFLGGTRPPFGFRADDDGTLVPNEGSRLPSPKRSAFAAAARACATSPGSWR
jgi:DNA invertase Pin-like site-specific DNA recombinase